MLSLHYVNAIRLVVATKVRCEDSQFFGDEAQVNTLILLKLSDRVITDRNVECGASVLS